jgi:hypothetical protein
MSTHTIATAPTPLAKIDALALNLSKRRAALADLVAEIETEQRAVLARHRVKLRELFGMTAGAQAALQADVEAHPELFIKPRTLTLHGVKVGFTKGAGRMEIDDEARTIALAKKHLAPEQLALVVSVKESINKKAAASLSIGDLKKLAIRIEETGDRLVLSYTASALDALLERLLADAKEQEG